MQPKINPSLPRVFDSTIRASYVACLTQGYYSFQRKLGALHGSTDLIAGGAFARGLEVTRKAYYGSERLPFRAALEKGMTAAILEYGDHEPVEKKQAKSVTRVIEALAAYFIKYNPDTDTIQPHIIEGEPCVEFTFSLPLPINHPETGEPILYAGRFDLLGMRNKSQLLWVDEKTTMQLGPTWPSQWDLRGQFTGYTWACQQYGYPVLGGVVRGVSFTKEFGFAESLQLRARWQTDEWYEQLLRDIKRIVAAWESGWYDQNFSDSCSAYGSCAFKSLCSAHDPENWIEGRFGVRDWDPLKKVPYVQPEGKSEIVQLPEGVM